MNNPSGIAADILALPSGGPQLQPLGEKFQPDLSSGTGNFSVALAFPPGANGIAPDLSLRYTTGGGNGPFGAGWDIWSMRVSRSTLKGVPRYGLDPRDQRPDTFILSGAEELVPAGGGRYRPRTESRFWLIQQSGDHWTVTTKDGTRYDFGTSADSRIADEGGTGQRVFAWLLDRVTDPLGNEIAYRYLRAGNQLYLAGLSYGPYGAEFDYVERPDPFTDCRAGFPIETSRRCTEIRVTSSRAPSGVLRRYLLEYQEPAPEPRRLSLLSRVTLVGGEEPDTVALPPLRFSYAPFDTRRSDYRRFSSPDGFPPPRDLVSPTTNLVDLAGDGLPDLLATDPTGPVYWRNLGECRWARPKTLARFPGSGTLADPGVRFADLDGNGTADLLWAEGGLQGYFPNAAGERWEPMVHYRGTLPFSAADPNLRLYDVDGDGRIDAIRSDDESFLLYRNLGRDGWDPLTRVIRRRHDPATWPDVSFADPHVYVADLNGDGLSDIATVRSGEVAYWPYLGHGVWGARVVMGGSPVLPRNYDLARLFFEDIDGDGASDLVYVDAERVLIWINRGGREFGAPLEIAPIPLTASGLVLMADMRGVGRPGILFSYPRAVPGSDQYRYLSLGDDVSPYVMTAIDNGLGATTRIEYRSSTQYALDDLAARQPWRTFLPFPLQIVSAIEIADAATGVVARTEYRYHDGHYDGLEREFRGFGRVEEVQVGDPSVPTVIRENRFHPGTDSTLTEAERRALPAALRDELRALRGTLQSLDVWSLPFGDPPESARRTEEVRNDWQVRVEQDDANGRVLFPRLVEARHDQFADGEPARVTVVRYDGYDEFGNLLGKTQIGGFDDGTLHEELVQREEYSYARNAAHPERWVVGVLSRIARYDGAGVVQAVVNQYYDGAPFVGLPLGEIAGGAISRYEELVLRDGEALPAAFPGIDPATLGYHRGGDPARADEGWYRDKLRYRHLPNGAIDRIMDPLGQTATIAYDDLGISPVAVTDAAGLTITAAYDHAVAAIAAIANPSGYTDRREYDAAGRVRRVFRTTDAGALSLSRVIRYDHGDFTPGAVRPASIATLVCRETGQDPAVLENPATPLEAIPGVVIQRVFYGGTGLELQRIATAEPAADGAFRTTVSGARWFNVRGSMVAEQFPRFGTTFDFVPPPDAPNLAETHAFVYDEQSRVTVATRPDGARRITSYFPSRVVAIDEDDAATGLKNSRTESFDSWGRLVEVREHWTPTETFSTRYRYDLAGQLLDVTDHRGVVTYQNTYDRLNRKVQIEHVDAGVLAYLYDAASDLVGTVDAAGNRLRNVYDPIHRLAEVIHVAPAGETARRRFRYDADPTRPAAQFLAGRLAVVEDESGTLRQGYNAGGQVALKRRELPGGRVLESTRTYDALGNLARITYPDGAAVTYEFNAANLLEAIPGVVDDFDYNVMAQWTAITYANGVVSTFAYEPQTSRPRTFTTVSAGGALLQSAIYGYDPVGNVTSIQDDGLPTPTRHAYDYDGLHRLIEHTSTETGGAGVVQNYDYDAVGNIRRNPEAGIGTFAYTDVARPDLLTSYQLTGEAVPVAAAYDAAGNLSARGVLQHLDYDVFGRLQRVQRQDGVVVEFGYDYQGGRVSKRVTRGGVVAETLYFDDLYETRPDRSVRYVQTPSGVVAEIVVDDAGEHPLFQHADHLGSARVITDAAGNLVVRQAYTPFGLVTFPDVDLRRFLGREFDPDLGLYLFGARFYDPATGRFITPDILIVEDPARFIHNPQFLNLYAYAINNPLRYRDPSGRFIWVAAIIGFAIGAFIGGMAAHEAGGDLSQVFLGALVGGLIGFFTGGLGLLGDAVMGAGVGMLSAAARGDKIWAGAAIGFGFGALIGLGDWIPAVGGEGFWVDAANFSIEVSVDAGTSALQGGVTSSVNGRNFWDGFSSGLVMGAAMSSAKILIFGIKYDPFSVADKNQTMKQFAKDSLVDRSPVAREVQKAGWPQLRGVAFRRHGIFDLLNGGRSFVLGSNVNMASGQEYNIQVLAHEIRHIAQQQALSLGSVEFYSRYFWQSLTKSDYFYRNIPENTTFEVPTAI